MSAPIDDGGPAFPAIETWWNTKTGKHEPVGPKGMSLRDWFAGQALIGILSNHDLLMRVDQEIADVSSRAAVSIYAYGVADSMLVARKATP